MANKSWSTAVNGNWSDGAKWTPSAPTAPDDVFIGFGGATISAFTVTENIASVTVNSLTINGDATATGGIHPVTLSLVGNTLTVATDLFLESAQSLITGVGTVSVGGKIHGAGTITAKAGLLNLTGAGSLSSGLTFVIDTASPTTLNINMAGGASFNQPLTINNANQTLEIGPSAVTINNDSEAITEGTIKLNGGSVTDKQGITIDANADLIGFGTITTGTGKFVDLEGSGTVTASGGVLEISRATNLLAGGTQYHVANVSGSVLKFGSTVGTAANIPTVTFDTSPTGGVGALDLTNTKLSNFHAVVAQFVAGTAIRVLNADHVTLTGGTTLNVFNASNVSLGTIKLAETHTGAKFSVDPATDSITTDVVCYAAGTHILTTTGERAIEDLLQGDIILTQSDGELKAQPVKWLGHRRIDLTTHVRPETVAPIRIERDAIADGMPHRDLLVSPDHAIFVDGMLICARQLVNGTAIRPERGWTAVDYYHVELDQHTILLAEGLPAESYLDTGNNGFFANAEAPLVLHPDLTDETAYPTRDVGSCAPFVWDEASVRPVWQRLADRAAVIGRPGSPRVTTTDADLRLIADHRTVKPVFSDSDRVIFALPAVASEVLLVSRAQTPTEARPWLEDRRRLGVRVKRIVLRGADDMREVPLDHPVLTRGWWGVERNGQMISRWTDGEAVLPLPAMSGNAMLEIHLAGAMIYVADTMPDGGKTKRRAAA